MKSFSLFRYKNKVKRDLTPLSFQTSILCQRIGIAKDGFYSSMREGHKYDASDFSVLDADFEKAFAPNSNFQIPISTSLGDSDVNTDAPICIGMDYNANINWIVEGQPEGNDFTIYSIVVGMQETEYGYASLKEMESIEVNTGVPAIPKVKIQRDMDFKACALEDIPDDKLQTFLSRMYDKE